MYDEALRLEGNKLFEKHDYDAAIQKYSEVSKFNNISCLLSSYVPSRP